MTAPYAQRLMALRNEMSRFRIDAYLVPMADEFQSEYVPASAKRIEFLTGFTGSAGFLVVLNNLAAFFTDSRYTLQAESQMDASLFTLFDSAVQTSNDWLCGALSEGQTIGFDPWLHTDDAIEWLREAAEKKGASLQPIAQNLVDAIWTDRPPIPTARVETHDILYTGKSSAEKRAALATALAQSGRNAVVLTNPASIAWLLNVRGGDVPHTPLPLSYALAYNNGKIRWFIDPRKTTHHVDVDVTVEPLADFEKALRGLRGVVKTIELDTAHAPHAIATILRQSGVELHKGVDPTLLPRACKNKAELDGMRAAHRRDGAALTSFLAWLDCHRPSGFSELDAEKKLAEFRTASNLYRGPSFDTIAGADAHGAIVHYRATPESNAPLKPGSLFLLDSGGQYLDGTTDVTRTLLIGKSSTLHDEITNHYTRVLKGHIALATAVFPEGTTGADLDVLARQFLWQVGLDYGHGTGHGVGAYLGVHEGPQGISKRSRTPLRPGMVLSNEPGYYKAGHYGIRLENLQIVVEKPALSSEHKMLGFETLTLVPFDRHLIRTDMLTKDEIAWINDYHTKILQVIGPLVGAQTSTWLKTVTAAL